MSVLDIIFEGLKDSGVDVRRISPSEINLRCCYCGDSKKNASSKHMYIGQSKDDPDICLAYCQRCNAKKTVGIEFLRTHNVNSQIIPTIMNSVPKYKIREKRVEVNEKVSIKLRTPSYLAEKFDNKIYYFLNRTKVDPIKYYQKYKIIFSIQDFISDNEKYLEKVKFFMKPDLIKLLEEKYIGFLSYYNEHIVFRHVGDCPKDDKFEKRYYSITLDRSSKRIKCYAPLQSFEPGVIVTMTEGIFDGINLSNILKGNRVFISVLNKDYRSKIAWIIQLLGINIESFEFYIDNDDIPKFQMDLYIKRLLGVSVSGKTKIFKNHASKDVGDLRNPIDLREIKIG
jgi:hypothetical protein